MIYEELILNFALALVVVTLLTLFILGDVAMVAPICLTVLKRFFLVFFNSINAHISYFHVYRLPYHQRSTRIYSSYIPSVCLSVPSPLLVSIHRSSSTWICSASRTTGVWMSTYHCYRYVMGHCLGRPTEAESYRRRLFLAIACPHTKAINGR